MKKQIEKDIIQSFEEFEQRNQQKTKFQIIEDGFKNAAQKRKNGLSASPS